MMDIYYGRDSKPITFDQWAALIEDPDGRRVALTEVATPSSQRVLVSTVLVGLDMNFGGEGPPIIFETMTFDQTPAAEGPGWDDIEMRRYATEAEALVGHAEIVQWLVNFGYTPVVQEEPQHVRSDDA